MYSRDVRKMSSLETEIVWRCGDIVRRANEEGKVIINPLFIDEKKRWVIRAPNTHAFVVDSVCEDKIPISIWPCSNEIANDLLDNKFLYSLESWECYHVFTPKKPWEDYCTPTKPQFWEDYCTPAKPFGTAQRPLQITPKKSDHPETINIPGKKSSWKLAISPLERDHLIFQNLEVPKSQNRLLEIVSTCNDSYNENEGGFNLFLRHRIPELQEHPNYVNESDVIHKCLDEWKKSGMRLLWHNRAEAANNEAFRHANEHRVLTETTFCEYLPESQKAEISAFLENWARENPNFAEEQKLASKRP